MRLFVALLLGPAGLGLTGSLSQHLAGAENASPISVRGQLYDLFGVRRR